MIKYFGDLEKELPIIVLIKSININTINKNIVGKRNIDPRIILSEISFFKLPIKYNVDKLYTNREIKITLIIFFLSIESFFIFPSKILGK